MFSTRFFTACHPVLPEEGRIALTLRLIGGLTTTEIASGDEWMREPLSEEAPRLAHARATSPEESEVHALLALMELNGSRTAGRRGSNGEAVLLPDQDRSLWAGSLGGVKRFNAPLQ
ncbi:DUF6596 domain-containing protein [Acidicapsa dinghuensis]|uniref:DUF6596 domain-containing protein n=1 Tax=Acidicapsa dinghuensis TaxID=2218256 RepID=A0ABW1EET2_9BACT|nr:DUF6596 domain-containing protein [Acidicapsa dinghuensis]